MKLRQFCLHYGSGLLFTSIKSNTNINLAYDYIISKLYGQELPHASRTDDKEALFIPCGLESMDLIKSNLNINSYLDRIAKEIGKESVEDLTFEDLIKKPEVKVIPGAAIESSEEKVVQDWKS